MPHKPILRREATQYFENVLIAFVSTLLGTRAFLELTGYPRIGSGGLHIAHVLWGGLLLLVASLVLLSYRNRPFLSLSSFLVGVGWALFVDELGKFVTANNDYFFRPAAPIIYLSFLCLWFVALYLRRPSSLSARARIYHILDDLEEVIEASADPGELAAMRGQLLWLSSEHQEGITDELALALLHFIDNSEIKMAEQQPSAVTLGLVRVRETLDRVLLSEPMTRRVLPAVLGVSAGSQLVYAVGHALPLLWPTLEAAFHADLDVSPFSSPANLWLFVLMIAVQVLVAVLLLALSFRLLLRDDDTWDAARKALMARITVVGVLLFYFTQFSAAAAVFIDVALLGWVNQLGWRRRLRGLRMGLAGSDAACTSGEAGAAGQLQSHQQKGETRDVL